MGIPAEEKHFHSCLEKAGAFCGSTDVQFPVGRCVSAGCKCKTPVYFVIGENDEYYGSRPFKSAYQKLYELYRAQGLSKKQIDKLLVLDVKGSDYFAGTPVTYQHGGGYLFCRDEQIMGWLFEH